MAAVLVPHPWLVEVAADLIVLNTGSVIAKYTKRVSFSNEYQRVCALLQMKVWAVGMQRVDITVSNISIVRDTIENTYQFGDYVATARATARLKYKGFDPSFNLGVELVFAGSIDTSTLDADAKVRFGESIKKLALLTIERCPLPPFGNGFDTIKS